MKGTTHFLKALLAVSLLFQGATLAATCVVPCHMADAAKLRCVMGSMAEHEQASSGAQSVPVLSQGACGHLEFRDQLPAISVAKVKLAKVPSEQIFTFVPSMGSASKAVLEAINTRAGPLEPDSGQALLAVPPQNAPPVLV